MFEAEDCLILHENWRFLVAYCLFPKSSCLNLRSTRNKSSRSCSYVTLLCFHARACVLHPPAFAYSISYWDRKQKNVWNYFKVINGDTRSTSLMSFWCLYCQLWTDFTYCSSVSNFDFKQVNTIGYMFLEKLELGVTRWNWFG